jgi:hypothetical protein
MHLSEHKKSVPSNSADSVGAGARDGDIPPAVIEAGVDAFAVHWHDVSNKVDGAAENAVRDIICAAARACR